MEKEFVQLHTFQNKKKIRQNLKLAVKSKVKFSLSNIENENKL